MILIITTSSTINSYYDYAMITEVNKQIDICPEVLKYVDFEYLHICTENNKIITDKDRETIIQLISEDRYDDIIILNDINTTVETLEYLNNHLCIITKRIILIGSIYSLTLPDSDAVLNLALGIVALKEKSSGITVIVNGKIYLGDKEKPYLISEIKDACKNYTRYKRSFL